MRRQNRNAGHRPTAADPSKRERADRDPLGAPEVAGNRTSPPASFSLWDSRYPPSTVAQFLLLKWVMPPLGRCLAQLPSSPGFLEGHVSVKVAPMINAPVVYCSDQQIVARGNADAHLSDHHLVKCHGLRPPDTYYRYGPPAVRMVTYRGNLSRRNSRKRCWARILLLIVVTLVVWMT